jgi:hypothetical protein
MLFFEVGHRSKQVLQTHSASETGGYPETNRETTTNNRQYHDKHVTWLFRLFFYGLPY